MSAETPLFVVDLRGLPVLWQLDAVHSMPVDRPPLGVLMESRAFDLAFPSNDDAFSRGFDVILEGTR